MTPSNPSADLFRLINGFQVSQAVHVAAVLGIADLLSSGTRDVDGLAKATRTHAGSLYRLLRALSSGGVLREEEDRKFSLTPMGEYLRSDIPGSRASWAKLIGRENYWQAWGALSQSIRTGETAFDHVHGSSVWAYRSTRPEESDIFDHAMATITEQIASAAIEAFDFGRYHHLVDLGGGQGAFIGKVLATLPGAQGTLFDQPHVVAQADRTLDPLGVKSRCQVVGGDFFQSVPAGGNAYILKWILHDWDDAASLAILKSCRRAIREDGVLVVVEHVIGPANIAPDGKFMDLNMLVITGGIERTQDEFSALFESAGFRLTRVVPTKSPLSIVEGIPV